MCVHWQIDMEGEGGREGGEMGETYRRSDFSCMILYYHECEQVFYAFGACRKAMPLNLNMRAWLE